jgi:hypothetical protein
MTWADLDTWAKEQRSKLPPVVRRIDGGESRDARRTREAKTRIERGYHPKLGRLLGRWACGDCGNCLTTETPSGRTHYKCRLVGVTRGPGTDIRVGWPACERFAAGPGVLAAAIDRLPAEAREAGRALALAGDADSLAVLGDLLETHGVTP